MVGGGDGGTFPGRTRHLGNVNFMPTHIDPRRQIEVAVEKVAVPGHGNECAAHHAGNGTGVKTGGEFFQVHVQIVRFYQPLSKSSQGHIGEVKQVIETNTPFIS